MVSKRLDREFRHLLRRCRRLSDPEVRLLALVSSYSQGCHLNYEEILNLTGWSRSKLIRTINSLKKHGLLEVKYRAYKRTTLRIVQAWRQTEFALASDVSPLTHDPSLAQDTDISHLRNYDVSPMTHSILERELERKIESAPEENQIKEVFDPTSLIVGVFPDLKGKLSKGAVNQ